MTASHPQDPRRGVPDPQDVLVALTTVVHGSRPLTQVLDLVVVLAGRAVPGVGHASVTLVSGGQARSVAVSSAVALALDKAQYATDLGPCLDAARTGDTVEVPSTDTDRRYPTISLLACRHGVTSTLSVGLPVSGEVIGALNLYGSSGGFDADAEQAACSFAGSAAVALANATLLQSTAELAANLQTALGSRAVIEQAKGMLMSRHACSVDEAFTMLSDASQRSNRKIRDIARAMVEGTPGRPPRPG